MAEITKLDKESDSSQFSCAFYGVDDKMDETNRKFAFIGQSNDKPDSFVLDVESFSHGAGKEITANSSITLQRTLTRKSSQRGCERKPNCGSLNDRASSGGGSMTEKPILPPPKVVAVGTAELTVNPQAQHQITITAGSINTASENRFLRRNSFRRSPPSWFLDSRKILYLCATLSSMGTIILIYFTLSLNKINGASDALD